MVDSARGDLEPPKRVVHAPKRYVADAALISAALRLNTQAVLNDGDMLGRILDTFVVAQLRPETIVAESNRVCTTCASKPDGTKST